MSHRDINPEEISQNIKNSYVQYTQNNPNIDSQSGKHLDNIYYRKILEQKVHKIIYLYWEKFFLNCNIGGKYDWCKQETWKNPI